MPGDLARVDAARSLPRADRAVMLDVARVQVERDRLPLEQRMHPGAQLIERPVELAEMAERETAQETPERRRLRQTMTTQQLLRRIGAQQRNVVEALAARDQRLAEREDRLRRRVTTPPLFHRQPVEQLADA